jgi:probable F420-dependent oxidoreductase
MPAPRPFRFGVVAAQARSGAEWAALARRAEQLGYSTLLVPDTLGPTLAPLTALAHALSSTERLRVGTYVLVADFRNPVLVAREVGTLDLLSGGRVELGLGIGRPGAEREYARLGISFDTPGRRVERLAAAIATITAELEAGTGFPGAVHRPRPPILVAAAGPRMLDLAARTADIVALAGRPDDPEAAIAERVARVREAAPDRLDTRELNLNLAVAGVRPHPQAAAFLGVDIDQLMRSGAPSVVLGTEDEMCAQLERRRETLGVSYLTLSAASMDAFAPVVARLAGR